MSIKMNYKCHECGEETNIVQSDDPYGNSGYMICCSHCGYEAGNFETVSDAELIIKINNKDLK